MTGIEPDAPGDPDPPSPCVDVCVLDENGEYCLGCGRSLDEIAAWATLTPDQKRAVLHRLAK